MSDDEESPPSFKRFKTEDASSTDNGLGANSFASRLMQKMGYQEGKGLGLKEQGITQPITLGGSTAKHGFGHEARKHTVNDPNVIWDDSAEEKTVEEFPQFLESTEEVRETIKQKFHTNWIIEGVPLETLRESSDFCDADLVMDVIEAKSVFDNLDRGVIMEARKRANPYETVMGGIFQNRAAMKTANLDKVFDWKLSYEFDKAKRLAKNPVEPNGEPSNVSRDEEMFYFADVCAGPGGFSEYMIWRKAFYNVKGFGFTLRGNDDFKLQNFRAGPAAFFETYYGVEKNGDVTNPGNLKSLEEYVMKRTNNKGCHLVMCDGGFSVSGKEEIQEILSKRLYLCQFIVGLCLSRVQTDSEPGGNYVCKLIRRVYSIHAFERISLHKPNTSRPANSERYIFCENLTKFGATVIKNYMIHINDELDKMSGKHKTILEIVPYDLMRDDSNFFDYLKSNNEEFARRQILYLNKYKEFSRNKGAFDSEQANLRENCLKYWEVPDKPRTKEFSAQPAQLALKSMFGKNTFFYGKYAPFSTNEYIWKQDIKQIRVREFCAVLLPGQLMFCVDGFLTSMKSFKRFSFSYRSNKDPKPILQKLPTTL
ncbi:Cap-specific mRNA (nucleoside-2'-O-)-methyltransferase 1 [Aphelenchoides bicaudatus]|nr:Cap-specific mRNA (nucleoside-2'-O-)-methyltransferase 1 [Aphelenchoides bicaudatus]